MPLHPAIANVFHTPFPLQKGCAGDDAIALN